MEQGYGQLFRYLGQMPHQSCLVLTSREQPKGLATLEGETLPVRSLKLTGLPLAEGRKIFQQQGTYTGSEFEWQSVLSHYAGNPLALKMVATAIQDLFESSLAKFIERLKQGTFVFSDLSDWIEEKLHLQPLPVHRLADYEVLSVCVTSHSTITVRCLLYSVPAQLIGQRLTIHLYQDRLLGFLGNQQVVELTRIYTPTDSNKRRAQSVNYRHVIDSLRRQPRAFLP